MSIFWRGFVEILPLSLAAAAYGLAFGVYTAQAGFSAAEVALMGITVFAGTSQIAAVESFDANGFVLGAILAAAMLNLRYIGIMATLTQPLARMRWPLKFLALQYTADENWAQTLTAQAKNPRLDAAPYHLGGGLSVLLFWLVSTVGGNLVGTALPAWTAPAVGFTFTAAFVAMLIAMLDIRRGRGRSALVRQLLPVVLTFIATLGFSLVPSLADFALLIAVAVGLAVGLWLGEANE